MQIAIPETEDKPKKYYRYKEDELLDEVEQHEKDMNEMLKYLAEVEDLIKGNDLKAVESMIDVTKEGMTQHFEAYDKLKEQILSIDKMAEDAIKTLTRDEPPKQDAGKIKSSKT